MNASTNKPSLFRRTFPLLAVCALALTFWAGVRTGRPAVEENGDEHAEATEASSTLYTCSMHPQVRLPDPDSKCPICFMDLIPVIDDGGDGSATAVTLSERALALADIGTTPVKRRFPRAEVRMVGKVSFDETRSATIAARFPGRLERIFVDYVGVPVQVGQHIGELYSPELLVAQAELRQAAEAAARTKDGDDMVSRATRATLGAAREKLRLWGLTPEQIQGLEEDDEPRESLSILSPVGGIVVEKSAQQGDYLKTGQTIVRVADLDHLWVELAAYESQLRWLRYGELVEFETDAAPGEVFEGRVSFIAPTVNPRTHTIDVRVNFDNTERRLKPGLFVRAVLRPRIDGEGRVLAEDLAGKWVSPMHPEIIKDAPGSCDVCGMDLVPAEQLGYVTGEEFVEAPLVIPLSAPLLTGKRAIVYVRDPDAQGASFSAREVRLGARAGNDYLVLDGLQEGELVVTRGAFAVDSAAQILAKPSMMGVAGEARETPPEPQLPAKFLDSLGGVFKAYLAAGTALAADDLGSYHAAVESMTPALEAVVPDQLAGEFVGRWARLARAFDLSQEDRAPDIARARQLYHRWSDAAIELAREFGQQTAESVQLVHCPMAFDFSGADWLQLGDEVSNPYFGDEMLRCGSVKERFARTGTLEAAGGQQGHVHGEDH